MSRRPARRRASPAAPPLYHHDDFGALIGETVARQDPEDPGRYLVPRNATLLPPPKARKGQVPVFDGQGWTLAVDARGDAFETATGRPVRWDRPGPLPEALTAIPPPSTAHAWDAAAGAWVLSEPDSRAAEAAALRGRLLDALLAGEEPDPADREAFRALRAARAERRPDGG